MFKFFYKSISVGPQKVGVMALLLFGLGQQTKAQTWQALKRTSLTTGISGNVAYTKVKTAVVNGVVVPYVVYTQDGVVKVKRFINLSWEAVGGNVSTGATATYPVIAIDGASNIYVAYRDNSNGDKAVLKRFNSASGTWEAVGGSEAVSPGSIATGNYANTDLLAIDFDAANNLYIAYSDVANSSKPTVSKLEVATNTWSTVGGTTVSSEYAYSPGIAVDASGNVYVSYISSSQSATNGTLKFYKFDVANSTWTNFTGALSVTARSASLVLDKTNSRLIGSIANAASANRASVVVFDIAAQTWQSATGFANFTAASNWNSIAADRAGNIYPVFLYESSATLNVRKFTAGTDITKSAKWPELNDSGLSGGVFNSSSDASLSPAHAYVSGAADYSTGTVYVAYVKDNLPVVAGFSTADLNSTNVLPVKLISYSAKSLGGQVRVEWETSSEIDNQKFRIERSQDGETFENLTEVAGKGASIYTVYDSNPIAGISYYRLTQIDNDGRASVLGVQAVNTGLNVASSVVAYPNPASNSLSVKLDDFTGEATVRLINLQGATVHSEIITGGAGSYALKIAQKPLAGNYILQVNAKEWQKKTLVVFL